MKKLIVILAIVAIASPVMAAVTINGSLAGTTGTLTYRIGGPNNVRAFAMDISVSTGNVTNVNCTNASYYVYPGSIQIQNGSIADSGNCVCSSAYPGTKRGKNTSAVTVEMGSLYTGTNKPASTGTLLTFTISNSAATVTVGRNTVRGAIVMERPEESAADNLPMTFKNSTDCLYVGRVFSGSGITTLTINTTHIAKWNYLGKPNCWCCPAQKRGNGVYSPSGTSLAVDNVDLGKVKNSNVWNKTYTQTGYNACSDINLSGNIDNVDLAKIKNSANWGKTVGAGSNCP